MKLAFALILLASPAWADCEHFKWSLARELAWFKSPGALPAEGGIAVIGQAYALTLSADVTPPVPPERPPAHGSKAAIVALPKVEAGLYQITLSQAAWVDVVQDGARVKSADFSGQRDCPGIHKSVRFPLAAGAATLEIDNAQAESIVFAVARAQ